MALISKQNALAGRMTACGGHFTSISLPFFLLRYLCHFDAAKVDLSGPDPKFGEGPVVNAQDVCRRPKAPLMSAA